MQYMYSLVLYAYMCVRKLGSSFNVNKNACYFSQGIDEESQLNLTPLQLRCLVDCILNEAALYVGTKQLKEATKLEVYEM